MTPFADMWEDWYRGTNAFAQSDDIPSPAAAVMRTQFQMLDAIVAAHMGCAEQVCIEKKAIRRVLEVQP